MFTTLATNCSAGWFASGTACAFIFLRGVSILPGIWLGSLLAYHFGGLDVGRAFGCAAVLTLQAYSLLKLNYRFSIISLVFSRWTTCLNFLCITVLITACGSLLLSYLCYSDLHAWLPWWLANFNGTVIVGCALAGWDAYFSELQKLKAINKTKLTLSYGTLLALIFMFLKTDARIFCFLILLVVVGISKVYKWCGLLAALFLLIFFLSFFPELNAPLFAKTFLAFIVFCTMILFNPFNIVLMK